MFAKSITGSARFLTMPVSARLLYYDLGMAADDDGVTEAFTVMRMTGASEDDLRILTAKGFVRILNEDLVVFITDWKRNNLIKKDRYTPSFYHDLLQGPDETTLLPAGTPEEPLPESAWNPDGTPMEPMRNPDGTTGKDRLGKDRSVKGRGGQETAGTHTPARCGIPSREEVAAYCREIAATVNADYFHSYYSGKGWCIGRSPITDWRATLRAWDAEDRSRGRHTHPDNTPGSVTWNDPLNGLF